MKKLTFIGSLLFILIGCSEPTVTAEYRIEEQISRETQFGGRQVTFRGSAKDNYVVFDGNKQCPHSPGHAFRTYKPFRGAKINSGDHCAYCGYTWTLHKDN